MDVLSSRTLVRPSDFTAGVGWFRDVLGLNIYREYGAGGRVAGVVFFLGGGFLEVVGGSSPVAAAPVTLWLQVPDVDAEHERLSRAGVTVLSGPETQPWGLRECWISGPDDVTVILVQVPETHPLRRRVD